MYIHYMEHFVWKMALITLTIVPYESNSFFIWAARSDFFVPKDLQYIKKKK